MNERDFRADIRRMRAIMRHVPLLGQHEMRWLVRRISEVELPQAVRLEREHDEALGMDALRDASAMETIP